MIRAKQPNSIPPSLDREPPLSAFALSEILQEHNHWLDSTGEAGTQANFSGLRLESADLIDAKLRDAIFHKTNLASAELMLADLRGASLLQANLRDANLLGAQFQGADLQAAVLTGATGLVPAQLARANLFGAVLPEAISPLDGLKHVRQMAGRAGWFLAAMLGIEALVWLRIFTTRDAQLLRNAPALPFWGLQAELPYIPFYLFGPVAVLCLFVGFHLYLQAVWDGAAQLPAIFQDGRKLDACLPWFAKWPAQMNCKVLKQSRSPLAFLEAAIAILVLYWVAPATIVLFWGRYLTLQDLRGATVDALLCGGSVFAATNFPKMAARAFGAKSLPLWPNREYSALAWAHTRTALPAAVTTLLFLCSVGIIAGVPHNSKPAENSGPGRVKMWSAGALWLAGYDPFPQWTETDVSVKPAAWSGRDEDLPQVQGASLNRLRLRYVQGYGAFLARAHLWQADLRHAYLADADLRAANLRQANLQFAVLDGAKLKRAMMQQADLRSANLDRSDLTGANLSTSLLQNASLLDAALNGANLYKADLSSAVLQRASVQQTDLRETNLEGANLSSANLRDAYLTSANLKSARLNGADLARAILSDADVRNADFRGASLQGAILNGADFTGANFQGTDLREASGLSASQLCSTAAYAQAQMDESLRLDAQVQCPNHR